MLDNTLWFLLQLVIKMILRPCIPSELNPPANTTLVTCSKGMADVVHFLSNVEEFGLDLETNMVDGFYDRRIRTIQVGNRQNQYVIDLLAFAGSTESLVNGMGDQYRSSCIKSSGVDYVRNTLRPYLETDKIIKVGYSLSFEYETIKWNLGLRIYGLYDCFLVEKVLNSGKVDFKKVKNFWGMDDCVARYCGLQISKGEQKTFDLSTPLTPEQITYAGLDTRFPIAMKGAQEKRVEALKLNRTVKLENDAIPAFGDMHLNGMLINTEKWLAEISKTQELHVKNIELLDELFIPIVGLCSQPHTENELNLCEKFWRDETDKAQRADYRTKFYKMRKANKDWEKKKDKIEGKANVQYGSPGQLLAALRLAKVNIGNTNDDTLEVLEGNKYVDAVREFRTTEKILDSYSQSYLDEHIHPKTGRVHAIFDQLGAATGRTASRKPNMQNINKESVWRECFIARPGKVILTIDYSGCELRILAEVSGEKVWIDAFNAGWDVHSVGAEMIFGAKWKDAACKGGEIGKNDKGEDEVLPPCAYYNKDHKKCKCPLHKILRDYIKSINFGIAYGMEAKKLARKIKVSVEEAKELLRDYRLAFKKVTACLERLGNEAKALLKSVTLAGRIRFYNKPDWELAKRYTIEDCQEDGKQFSNNLVNRTYTGMFASIERQGKNSPIQGTNADMVKLSVGCGYDSTGESLMWHRLEPEFGALLLSSVHDECVIEADESNAKEVFDFACGCMFRGGNEFLTVIKAEVEGHIKNCWSKG